MELRRGERMNIHANRRPAAFTLVELLTVIAIISLLIGVLVPAFSTSRAQAKAATSRAQIRTLEQSCNLFQNDNGGVPQSRGPNPFEYDGSGSTDVNLTGAQWLALQLSGFDRSGWVKPILANDSGSNPGDGDGKIDMDDWRDWYDVSPQRDYTRFGPYVESDPKIFETPNTYVETHSAAAPVPAPMQLGSNDWGNGRCAFYVDGFGFPILYYAATPQVNEPFTTGTPGSRMTVGRFDQSDNAFITGSDTDDGRTSYTGEGWDFAGAGVGVSGAGGFYHPLGIFGYEKDQTEFPEPASFAGVLSDPQIYSSTQRNNRGKIWPYKADSFLLISPGKDGLFGTTDDIRNFEKGQ